jgi:PAS domain S-box-containing protein
MSRTLPLEMLRKDGTTVWTEVKFSFIRDENQRPVGILGVTRDITERKRSEEALTESEKKYKLLVENANESVYVVQDGVLMFANRMCGEVLGLPVAALMGLPMLDFIHPDDRAKSISQHRRMLNGEQDAQRTDFCILTRNGEKRWADVNSVAISWDGKAATLNFATDITDRKLAEKELQRTLESLRNAVGATIQVMVSAVEIRDPYTAGHQIRSANLARAIATEMGLPQEKIDGIRMVGSIHDIGKLSIPAEILSKPTKLSEIEFSLIKEHSYRGYEILKDVESPWPLAQIVYQHHERMNGSGYPRNLKGDEILMEARILAVADVVESMASHRPYRPALGIDAALEEIEKNNGTLYDNTVADACLRLFREKGFQLEGI